MTNSYSSSLLGDELGRQPCLSGKHVNLQQPAVCDAEEKTKMLGFHPSLSHGGARSCEKSELLNGDGGGEEAGSGKGEG